MHDTLTAADLLEGHTVGDWEVVRKIERPIGATGGNFSVGYEVRDRDGRHAFLKAIDYSRAFGSEDFAESINVLTDAYLFERDLLRTCRDERMSRVVHAIDDGQYTVHGAPLFPRVNFLVFEWADGDVRRFKDFDERFDAAWALRALHSVALGLWQLHRRGVAHQDVKPSNALTFEGGHTKVADLGCAAYRGHVAPRDHLVVPGDPSYAPPELLYPSEVADRHRARVACDLYHLGSLVCFMFAATSMTHAIAGKLAPDHAPGVWSASFGSVLPFVREAFDSATTELSASFPSDVRERLLSTVRCLCEPDPTLRGHPKSRTSIGDSYSLERFVAEFDLLAKRAEWQLRAASR